MIKMKLSYYDRSDWVRSMTKTKLDNDVTDHKVLSTPKLKLNCRDLSGRMLFVMKPKLNKDAIDHTCVVYVEYETKLS